MNTLLEQVKQAGEDFEWYPTTRGILETISVDMNKVIEIDRYGKAVDISVLDIGAGNGSALNILDELQPKPARDRRDIKKYAIEKSGMLINAMPPDVYVVGTDFHSQTLIDKQVDVIFCNPPYSEYERWAEKIIAEANCKVIYLVIPERWKASEFISRTIERRLAAAEVIGSFDFLHSEFRQARAKVDILRIKRASSYEDSLPDPFDTWFDEFFHIAAEPEIESDYTEAEAKKKQIRELIKGQNLIERLEELYTADLEHLYDNYRAIEELDYEIFKELGVDLTGLKEGLKLKIKGLKSLYWQELFDNLDSITSRLTKKSRDSMLGKLTAHTSVDFTSENAYAVVIWAIKNANLYIDQQLREVYEWMSFRENVHNYKSNTRFIEDGWRYDRQGMEKYSLDYRLVFRCAWNFTGDSWRSYDFPNGLARSTHENINDILTIAKNLGFSADTDSFGHQWEPGKEVTFWMGEEELMAVRAYKNGNIHCKMNQAFMRKLNVEAGRLNGWVKSPQEAAEEMDIPIEEAEEIYGTNLQITPRQVKLLEAAE